MRPALSAFPQAKLWRSVPFTQAEKRSIWGLRRTSETTSKTVTFPFRLCARFHIGTFDTDTMKWKKLSYGQRKRGFCYSAEARNRQAAFMAQFCVSTVHTEQ